MSVIRESSVLDALKVVTDPDLGRDIVSLGFVKNLAIDDGRVSFTIEPTTPACPVKDQMRDQAQAAGAQDVLAEADLVGSTSGMTRDVGQRRPNRVGMVTACSISDTVAAEFSRPECVRPCNLCPHMMRITLPKILRSLETLQYPVVGDAAGAERARRAVERMRHVYE